MLHKMDEDEDNVYMTSTHDRYAACPDNLEGICLAKFAVNYEPLLNSGGNDEQNNIFDHAHIVMKKVILMMTYRSQTLLR